MEYYFIICAIISTIAFLVMVRLPYNKCLDIENDSSLKQFQYEIKNQRNDGWLQLYYREKYQERLNYLLNEKGVSTWWWRIYRWSSCQNVIS